MSRRPFPFVDQFIKGASRVPYAALRDWAKPPTLCKITTAEVIIMTVPSVNWPYACASGVAFKRHLERTVLQRLQGFGLQGRQRAIYCVDIVFQDQGLGLGVPHVVPFADPDLANNVAAEMR